MKPQMWVKSANILTDQELSQQVIAFLKENGVKVCGTTVMKFLKVNLKRSHVRREHITPS